MITETELTRVLTLRDRGSAANSAGRPAQAARYLHGALRLLDRAGALSPAAERARIRVLLALASAEFERTGRRSALPLLRTAVEAARRIEDDELTALAHSQRAMVLARSGNLGAALVALDRAADSVHALGPRDQCVWLNNRGMLLLQRGEIARARTEFVRSRRIAARHGLPHQEFMAAHNLGDAAYLAGDLAEALELMAEADRIDTDVSRAPAWHDQGRVLLDAGLITEAAQRLRDAAALGAERRQQHVHSEIELDLARALALLGEPRSAAALARHAQSVFARRRAPIWAARAQLVALGIELPQSRRPRSVALTARRVAARAEVAGDPALAFDAHLLEADAWLAAGAVKEAESALDLVPASTSLTTRLHRSLLQATLLVARDEPRGATTVLRRAATDLRRAQSRTASLDLRTATAVHGVRLAALDLELTLGRSPAAFLASTERWRLTTGRLPSVRAVDPAYADLMAALREAQEQIRLGRPSGGVVDRAAQLQREIREHGWTVAAQPAATPDRPPLGVSRLREALKQDDSDLVSYVVVGDALVGVGMVRGRLVQATVAGAEQVRQTCLRAATDLQAAASFHLGPLFGAVWGSLEATMAELDRALLGPFAVHGRRLVVVPARAVTLVPWGMLPSRVGCPTTIARSGSAWARGRRVVEAPEPTVRAFAGPDLAVADAEARAVAAHWPGALALLGSEATATSLRQALTSADVVHVAAHGLHNQQSPLFSSIRLADGPFIVHEVETSGVHAGHVVLSACDVGRATVRPGDEPLGMASGLLSLGASCVVASTSRIPDEIASAAMRRYHAELASGRDAAESLAIATEASEPVARSLVSTGSTWRAVTLGRRNASARR